MDNTTKSAALTPRKHWFHGSKRGERFGPIVGLFQTREDADARLDGSTWFMAWRTASYANGTARGSLNELLEVIPFISQRQTWALARQAYQREP